MRRIVNPKRARPPRYTRSPVLASRRKLLLVLAPLAAVLGMLLAWRASTPSQLHLGVTRTEVVRTAQAIAAAKGVKTAGWQVLVDLKPDNTLRHFLIKTATPAERAAIERVLAPVVYRCMIVNSAAFEDSVRVTMTTAGRVLTYKVPPVANAPQVDATQARAIADAELARMLGANRDGFTFLNSDTRQHEGTKSEIRTFRYRRNYGQGFGIEATVEIAGAKPVRFAVEPKLPAGYEKRFPELGRVMEIVRGATILLAVVGGFIYIVTRFVRRLRENEIPLKRTLIVSVIMCLAFIGSSSVGGTAQQIDQIERGIGNAPTVQFVMTTIMSAIMGVFIGMTWGATEADLRESYPEKLVSTDALLGGRFFSRPVRNSVVMGLAVGAYASLLSGIEPFLRLPRSWSAVGQDIGPYQTTYPALALILFAFVGLPITMGLLLGAVSITHRRGPTRNAKIGLCVVVLTFFLLTTSGTHSPLGWGIVYAVIAAAVLLVPFFIVDVLAVIVSITFSLWLIGPAALIAQPSAALRSGGWMMLAGLAAIIGIGAIAAARRRDEPEVIDADRPEYARNMAERMMLRSEMDAARQAQVRVMPRVVPQVEGVALAARHAESAEIGSDYFEFFPTATHVSVAVADSRMPGLSSALCVSMLKGLLLNYAARIPGTRDVADRVYRQLASIFGDDLPLSFFYGRLDRASGAFSFATFGAAPRAVILRNGEALSLEGEEYADLGTDDALVIYTARLADLRDRDGGALGDEAIHRELVNAATHDPQKLVDALHELAARHARGAESSESWAAVGVGRMS